MCKEMKIKFTILNCSRLQPHIGANLTFSASTSGKILPKEHEDYFRRKGDRSSLPKEYDLKKPRVWQQGLTPILGYWLNFPRNRFIGCHSMTTTRRLYLSIGISVGGGGGVVVGVLLWCAVYVCARAQPQVISAPLLPISGGQLYGNSNSLLGAG